MTNEIFIDINLKKKKNTTYSYWFIVSVVFQKFPCTLDAHYLNNTLNIFHAYLLPTIKKFWEKKIYARSINYIKNYRERFNPI